MSAKMVAGYPVGPREASEYEARRLLSGGRPRSPSSIDAKWGRAGRHCATKEPIANPSRSRHVSYCSY